VGIALSQSDDSSMIQLDGAVGITCAAELKAALLKAIEAGKRISICAGKTTDLDVTAFQLLWAAEREAKKLGKKFALQRDLPESVRSSLAGAGLVGLQIVE
jgi:anti-anti-sigma regulatory factor